MQKATLQAMTDDTTLDDEYEITRLDALSPELRR